MNELMNERSGERTNEWTDEQTNELTNERRINELYKYLNAHSQYKMTLVVSLFRFFKKD